MGKFISKMVSFFRHCAAVLVENVTEQTLDEVRLKNRSSRSYLALKLRFVNGKYFLRLEAPNGDSVVFFRLSEVMPNV